MSASWVLSARRGLTQALSRSPNLVPRQGQGAPSYWCTWSLQNYVFYRKAPSFSGVGFLNGDANREVEAQLTESHVFGPDGWAKTILPRVRNDLYFLFDEGWERGGYASFELDQQKFPGFTGSSTDQLKRMNDDIRKLGWRGAAVWCRGPKGGENDVQAIASLQAAGIEYCKIDQGDNKHHLERVRNDRKAKLLFEHVAIEGPVNGDWEHDGRFKLDKFYPTYPVTSDQPADTYPRTAILHGADVYRTYDVTSYLSLPTTLDRVGQVLFYAQGRTDTQAIINVEDEVYVAAALGCTMGIMRHPYAEVRADGVPDWAFAGPRQIKRRMDEVVRALRWQRIAAPFPSNLGKMRLSEETLTDAWQFGPHETWFDRIAGKLVKQGAPAIMARDIDLPVVSAAGEKPFVIASRFPSGAVAVAVHERTTPGKAWYMPPASVRLSLAGARGPIGIFGQMDELRLVADTDLTGARFLAQDLAGDAAVDVTRRIRLTGTREVVIPGSLIREIGLGAATPGDLSSPGLVLDIRPRVR